ncbi:MAG: Maf-like protein [Bradyrhizobium sp.]|nr:Maf-like protein [Bradyrhizobium sp.]
MLESAGVPFSVSLPAVDEDVLRNLLSDSGKDAFGIAGELAEAKALSVSRHMSQALVLGADQVLFCDGVLYSKALTADEAHQTLRALSGRKHRLISAAVIARDSTVLWRTTDVSVLSMRDLTSQFVESYLAAELPEILGSVGCYRIEARGAQLFEQVSGDYFSIRGLPLIPLLAALRGFGVIPA